MRARIFSLRLSQGSGAAGCMGLLACVVMAWLLGGEFTDEFVERLAVELRSVVGDTIRGALVSQAALLDEMSVDSAALTPLGKVRCHHVEALIVADP